ncbi:MAG: LysE family translocator [Firmicutes bacterium]|nr:LysE family translocator [Bacillota bacterium]
MLDISTLITFVGAVLLLLIIPGPAVIYIVTRSIDQGRTAGIVSVLGISVGTLAHVVGTAFGLSAILVSSVTAFTVVKYIGAIYLIYLGIRELFNRSEVEQHHFEENVNLKSVFYEGVLVNLLNPKVALFMFALLPQFINVSNGAVPLQILSLGLILVVLGIGSDSIYALLASSVRGWLKKHHSILAKQKYFTGTVYITLGMITALSSNKR